MGKETYLCNGYVIFYPYLTLAVLVAALVLMGLGFFRTLGEISAEFAVPGFLLLILVFAAQAWSIQNSYAPPSDVSQRTARRLPEDLEVVQPPTSPRLDQRRDCGLRAHYAVQYVTAAGLSMPVVSVVDGVPVVGYGQRLAAV